MRGVNKVMLIGNIGKDPELQYLEGNIPVVKVPLATTETYKDRNGKIISQTEWHNVVFWRSTAELANKVLRKGSLIYVEGRLKNRAWEDKQGNKKYITEVVADNLVMLEKRPVNPTSTNETKDFEEGDVTDINPNDNLPF